MVAGICTILAFLIYISILIKDSVINTRNQKEKTNIAEVKKLNFSKILQHKLNSIFYSYSSLDDLPIFPAKINGEKLIFENRAFSLRRFHSTKENRFPFFFQLKDDPTRRISVFFIIEDLDIDKSKLYQVFQDPEELDLVFGIIGNGEYAIKAFKILWDFTPEGDLFKAIKLDVSKLTSEDIDRAKVRWRNAEQINRYMTNIEKNITKLRKEYKSTLIIKKYPGKEVIKINKGLKYKVETMEKIE